MTGAALTGHTITWTRSATQSRRPVYPASPPLSATALTAGQPIDSNIDFWQIPSGYMTDSAGPPRLARDAVLAIHAAHSVSRGKNREASISTRVR